MVKKRGHDHAPSWLIQTTKVTKDSWLPWSNSSSASSQAITALAWHNKKCIKSHWMKQTVMQYRTIASPMLCVCCSDGGVDKELWNVCDAACQHVMTKQSSTFRSTQPCPAPLSLSLAPHSFPPFLFSFLSLLYLMLLSPPLSSLFRPSPPPPPPVKLLFFCSALTHSSSMLRRGKRQKQKGRGWKGEEKRRGG